MSRPAACENRNAPVRLTSMTFCHLSSGIVFRRFAPRHAGVVDEDVDAAEGGDRLVDDGLHVVLVRDVAERAFDAEAARAHVGDGRRQPLLAPRAQHQRAPASARPSAISCPRPREPPVTIATRPVKSNNWLIVGTCAGLYFRRSTSTVVGAPEDQTHAVRAAVSFSPDQHRSRRRLHARGSDRRAAAVRPDRRRVHAEGSRCRARRGSTRTTGR